MNTRRSALFLTVPLLAARLALAQEPSGAPVTAVDRSCQLPAGADAGHYDLESPWQELAAECNGGDCFNNSETAGLIWCGSDLTLGQAAEAAAPILWYSPDEPLLRSRSKGGLPERYVRECTTDCKSGRTYYYVARKKDGTRPPPTIPGSDTTHYENRRLDLGAVTAQGGTFIVNFIFYYSKDFGVNGHAIDLEGAEFKLRLSPTKPLLYRLNLDSVKAAAHGLNWAANRLKVRRSHWNASRSEASDTLVPLTLLVEEGKHASCPDRNGDGDYTPGFDVNALSNDAWGIRDVFGSGVLTSKWDRAQTKDRREDHRWFPQDRLADGAEAVRRAVYERGRGPAGAWNKHRGYRLEPACIDPNSVRCEPGKQEVFVKNIQETAEADATKRGVTGLSEPEDIDPLRSRVTLWKRINERLPISYRAERGSALAIMVPYQVELPGLHLMAAPRVIVRGGEGPLTTGLALVVSPSLSRWSDWYFAPGWARFGIDNDGFAWEGGLRFRVKPLILHGKLPLLGLRIGMQLQTLRHPRNPRLVIELGSGYL